MSFKTIMVHVDQSKHTPKRVKVAIDIALRENAHLIGAASTGISRYVFAAGTDLANEPGISSHLRFLRQRAENVLDDFDAEARRAGLHSAEKRLIDDETASGISLQGRFSDLIVIGQTDMEDMNAGVMPDFPEYVVVNSGRPVLIVPYGWTPAAIGNNILIAWDGSLEACRTVVAALPFLKNAQTVKLVSLNPAAQPDLDGDVPGNDVALYLARHGVRTEVVRRVSSGDIGNVLLTMAAESGADMIVMGGYGHSRFREILLGGITRTILDSMTVPALMSH